MLQSLQQTTTTRTLIAIVIASLVLPLSFTFAQTPAPLPTTVGPAPDPVLPPNAAALVPSSATSSPAPIPPPFVIPTPVVLPPVQLDARTQARIKNLAANVSTKHEQTFARLRAISDRLNARIQILKAQGIDTAAAESKMQMITANLVNGEGLLLDIDTKVSAAVSAQDGGKAWSDVTPIYSGSKSVILTILVTLREVVITLDPSLAATSTQMMRPF